MYVYSLNRDSSMLQYLRSGFFLPSLVMDHVPHLTHVPMFHVFMSLLLLLF